MPVTPTDAFQLPRIMAALKLFAFFLVACTFVYGQSTLPPMADAPDGNDDPYNLQCAGGQFGCSSKPGPPPSFFPSYCYYGYCTYINYINGPWSHKGDLKIQPKCDLPIGNRVIQPGKLRLRIIFFTGKVHHVEQWSFKELYPYLYTNEYTYWGWGTMEFQFQVHYEGDITHWPVQSYTKPPRGICVWYVAY